MRAACKEIQKALLIHVPGDGEGEHREGLLERDGGLHLVRAVRVVWVVSVVRVVRVVRW